MLYSNVFDELIKTLCEVYTFHLHLCHCQTNALTHNVKSCKQMNEGKNKCKTSAWMNNGSYCTSCAIISYYGFYKIVSVCQSHCHWWLCILGEKKWSYCYAWPWQKGVQDDKEVELIWNRSLTRLEPMPWVAWTTTCTYKTCKWRGTTPREFTFWPTMEDHNKRELQDDHKEKWQWK